MRANDIRKSLKKVTALLAASVLFIGCSGESGGGGNGGSSSDPSGSVSVTSVVLNKPSARLITGVSGYSTVQLTATVNGTNLTDADKGVAWTSSNESAATVDQNGLVTAVAAGDAVITATSTKDTTKKATCSVTVSGNTVSGDTVWNFSSQPAGIGTDGTSYSNLSIAASSGTSASLTVASASDLKWASGYLQSGKNGVDYNSYTTSSKATFTLTTTATSTITIIMSGAGGDPANYRWIVVTDSSGNIVGKVESSVSGTQQTITIENAAAGTYTIYTNGVRIHSITVAGQSSGGTIVPPTGVTLNKTTLEFDLADDTVTETLTATLAPADVTSGFDGVEWSSSDVSVATVSSSGLVTAKKAGTAIITVTTVYGSYTASCTVTVTGGGNVIRASDLPVGFASAGTYTTTPTTASYGTYANPVTTYAQLKAAISSGGLIYVKGMIPLAYYESSDGTVKGSMLPSTSGGTTPALDAFVADKTSYANYAAWKAAYIAVCETTTNDKSYSLCDIKTLYDAYKSIVQLNLKSNTTLIGIDSESGLVGGTLSISNVSNVAIRNLILRDAYDPFPHHEAKDGWNAQYDGIVIQNTTSGIWIDHCTIEDTMNGSDATNDYVTNASGKKEHWNPYDGQCDIKGTANSVTVSYCKFKNHDKSMLICSGDTDTGTKNVTIMNCGFYGITQRTPLVGIANVHMYNCYFDSGNGNYSSSYAIGCRYSFKVIAENNYFTSAIKESVKDSSNPTGSIYLSGNTDNSKSGVSSGMSSYIVASAPFTLSYSYSLDSAADIPAIVEANAGAGVWEVLK